MFPIVHLLLFSALSPSETLSHCPCENKEDSQDICTVQGKLYMKRKIQLIDKIFPGTEEKTLNVQLAMKVKGYRTLDFLLFPNESSIDVTWLPTVFDSQIADRIPPIITDVTHYHNKAKRKSRIIVEMEFPEVNLRMNSTFMIRMLSVFHPACLHTLPLMPSPSINIHFDCRYIKGKPCAEPQFPLCNLPVGYNVRVVESAMNKEVRIHFQLGDPSFDPSIASHLIAFGGECEGKTKDLFNGKCVLDINKAIFKRFCLPGRRCHEFPDSSTIILPNITAPKIGLLLCVVFERKYEWPRQISQLNQTVAEQILVSLPHHSTMSPLTRSFTAYVILGGIVLLFILYILIHRLVRRKQIFVKKLEKDQWELAETEVEINYDRPIGNTKYGSIYLGFLSEEVINNKRALYLDDQHRVAVKVLNSNSEAMARSRFMAELSIHKTIGRHTRIVNLIGATTKSEPLCIIFEYCSKGDLLGLLRSKLDYSCQLYEQQIDPTLPSEIPNIDFCQMLTIGDVLQMAVQICCGMEYLHSQSIIHRDLKAHNILVTVDGSVKISGLAACQKDGDANNYFRSHGDHLPIQWMAPESLKNMQFFKTSDVWSFGVVLFELCSLGGIPYPNTQPQQMWSYLRKGNREGKTVGCTDGIYSLMRECWTFDLSKRPSFEDIRRSIQTLTRKEDGSAIVKVDPSSDIYSFSDSSPPNSKFLTVICENEDAERQSRDSVKRREKRETGRVRDNMFGDGTERQRLLNGD